jgi:thioredoxin 1
MSNNLVHLTEENFTTSIAEGVFLVDFYAAWCAPCRVIGPVIEELAGKVQGKARVGKIDIDQAQQVAENLQITSIPTLILFKNGTEVTRIIGATKTLDDLARLIDSHS